MAEDLSRLSPEEFAARGQQLSMGLQERILWQWENERRQREAQHEFDRKLMLEQVRWMKFSIVAVIVASILSGLLGLLPWLLSRHQQQQPTVQTSNQVQTDKVSNVTSK